MSNKVSIIVPVYNSMSYIKKCLSSIVNQTYKNIEIILIDDGSTDGSYEFCVSESKLDKRIVVLRSSMFYGKNEAKNNGLETTRNCGIKYSTGEWVMFLDSDDEYVEDAVEKMVNHINPLSSLCIAPFYEVINGERKLVNASINEGQFSIRDLASHILNEIPYKIITCVGNKIYSKNLLSSNSIFFDSKYKFNEDAGFILSVLNKANFVSYCNCPFYLYNIRYSGSIQSSYRDNMFFELMKTYGLLKDFLMSNDSFLKLKDYYEERVSNVLLQSFVNEIHYKNYRCFKDTFYKIKNSLVFRDFNFKNKLLSFSEKRSLISIKRNTPLFIYVLIKIKLKIK